MKTKWVWPHSLSAFPEVSFRIIHCKFQQKVTEQSNLPPTTSTSVPVVSVSNPTVSNPAVISSTVLGLLLAAWSLLVLPAIRTIRLVSSSSASSPPSFPQNVLAPPTSPVTLCLPATSAQQVGHLSASVNSPGSLSNFQPVCQPDWAFATDNIQFISVHTTILFSKCSCDGP